MRRLLLLIAAFCLLAIRASAQVPETNTWKFVQDSIATACSAGATTCNLGAGDILSTTAGSVWIIRVKAGNNVTISSASGGSATWTHCGTCTINNGSNQFLDIEYAVNGAGGTTSMSVTMTGATSGSFQVHFIELMPPSGTTGVFDVGGGVSQASCPSSVCTGVGLTLTGTDVVFQTYGGNGTSAWNSWSAPYFTDGQGYGIALNVTSGTAPTLNATGAGATVLMAIAFKSTVTNFTPPTNYLSLVNFTSTAGLNCTPSCSLTIPSTGTGHLLYMEAANAISSKISSLSGGGTWVIPAACQTIFSTNQLSCGYVLSSSSGATSISITMTGSGSSQFFALFEVASTGGVFSLDAIGTSSTASGKSPPGTALTLTGTIDVIFQSIFCPGGISSGTVYPLPYINGQGHQFYNNQAASMVNLNTSSGAAPNWAYANNTQTVESGVAFSVPGPIPTSTVISGPTRLAGPVKVL